MRQMMTTNDITVSDARMDSLEDDVALAMDDLGWSMERAISAVVDSSDFVPENEKSAVAVELMDRLEDTETFQVEVYQPRPLCEFLREDRDPMKGCEEIVRELRDVNGGFLNGGPIVSGAVDFEKFTRLWTLVGGDTIEAKSPEDALNAVWKQWNNGSGKESIAFREANSQERAVSMSSGDIVRVDGDLYLCESFGWGEIDL